MLFVATHVVEDPHAKLSAVSSSSYEDLVLEGEMSSLNELTLVDTSHMQVRILLVAVQDVALSINNIRFNIPTRLYFRGFSHTVTKRP